MFYLSTHLQKILDVEVFVLSGNTLQQVTVPVTIPRIAFDTRRIDALPSFFVALQGNRDGHDFLFDAYTRGCRGFIVNKQKKEKVFEIFHNINPEDQLYFLFVEDTLLFLQNAARLKRNNFHGKVTGIVGANGKTSTKDFLCKTLSLYGQTFCAKESFNNELGVPLTILNAPDTTEYLVLEMGMNHKGEISLLSSIVKPDIVVIPSLGREHLAFFSSFEEVIEAELEFLPYLNKDSFVYYPYRAPLLEKVLSYRKEKGFTLILFAFTPENQPEEDFRKLDDNVFLAKGTLRGTEIFWNGISINNPQLHHTGLYSNLFLTFLVHYFCFLDGNRDGNRIPDTLIHTLETLQVLSKHRFRIHRKNGYVVIDDSYNANPDSFQTAIHSIKLFFPQKKVACFLGHMAELGEFSEISHRELGQTLARENFSVFAVCGNPDVLFLIEEYKKEKNMDIPYFESSEQLVEYLETVTGQLKNYELFFVKGSRSSKMELVSQKLLEVL